LVRAGGELQARCVVAAEGLKPQISPTRKKMVTCFPQLQPAQWQRSGSAVEAQWKRSGCAAAGGVKTTLMIVSRDLLQLIYETGSLETPGCNTNYVAEKSCDMHTN
jgi:hypothetical protein